MVEVAVDIPDVRVGWDLAADRWTVHRGSQSWVVRRWTWGERGRLLAWSTAPDGRLDEDRFVFGLLSLLVDGPVADEPAWLASVVLELLGVNPGAPAVPLGALSDAAARSLGWGPAELERQPLPEVEHLLHRLIVPQPVVVPEPVDDGWNRIVVTDD